MKKLNRMLQLSLLLGLCFPADLWFHLHQDQARGLLADGRHHQRVRGRDERGQGLQAVGVDGEVANGERERGSKAEIALGLESLESVPRAKSAVEQVEELDCLLNVLWADNP